MRRGMAAPSGARGACPPRRVGTCVADRGLPCPCAPAGPGAGVLGVAAGVLLALSVAMAALAGPLLGERAGWPVWTAVGVGFLGVLVMLPVWQKAWGSGMAPYLNGEIDFQTAWTLTTQPLRAFMLAQIRETDLMTFAGIAGHGTYASPDAVPFPVLVASFVTSELKTAFEIGFLIFIPFVIIDLVVASVLMSMGMMMLSPMLVSAPFKILLFVLVDGWVLIVGSLAASFN